MSLLCNASQRVLSRRFPRPRLRYLYALLRFNGRRVTSLKSDKTRRGELCAVYFIIEFARRRSRFRWTKRLLASRFIHAPLCCPVIDAVPNANANGLRYRKPVVESNRARARAGARTFHAVGFRFGGLQPFAAHFDANEVVPKTIRTELFAKFRTNCHRNAKLASIWPSFVPFDSRSKTRQISY